MERRGGGDDSLAGGSCAMTATERGAIAALAGLALAACAEGGPSRSALLDVGDSVPPSLELSNDRSALVWTLNSVDCLTCKLAEASWVARRLQHRSPHPPGGRWWLPSARVAGGTGRSSPGSSRRSESRAERSRCGRRGSTPECSAGVPRFPALYAVGRDGKRAGDGPRPGGPGRSRLGGRSTWTKCCNGSPGRSRETNSWTHQTQLARRTNDEEPNQQACEEPDEVPSDGGGSSLGSDLRCAGGRRVRAGDRRTCGSPAPQRATGGLLGRS